MPILDVEIVGDGARDDLAQVIADAAGSALGLEPARLWVKLRRIADRDYAENGGGSFRPVFVRILRRDPPVGAARAEEAKLLASVIAAAVERPTNSVHIEYAASGGGRIAFGGELAEPVVHRVYSGAEWEPIVGYCRAQRRGETIAITGTAPVGVDGETVAPGDAYRQTQRCFEIIDSALSALGTDRSHVTRTRIFVTDIARWEEYGRAHGEYFADHPPTTTMVEVAQLIDPEMLVEIEVDALLR